jgi:quercetin dioxygenase-like cupin family protein
MAVHFNESTVAPEPLGAGAQRQRLLTKNRVAGTNILLDRWTLGPAAVAEVEVPAGSLVWFQMLEGEARLTHGGGEQRLTDSHLVFLPPRFRGALASGAGAVLLHAEVPDAGRFDPQFRSHPPSLRVVDWKNEPVLDSQHDARKRIYVVTPKLFGVKAIKGEMIIYPPGTRASNHHHEGAEHFMYLTRGSGIAHANEEPFPVRKGDLVYYAEGERHYFVSDGAEDMVFVEFFVPGEYRTVWAKNEPVCTWLPSGRNIRGEKPAREIKAHGGADATSPQDV